MGKINGLYRVSTTKWPGVYYRELETRYQGKPDCVYYIAFKNVERKKIWEKVGKKSEGYTPQIADDIRSKRMRTVRHGDEVQTAREIQKEKIRHDRALGEIAELYFKAKGSSLKGKKTDKNRYEKHLSPAFEKRPVSSIAPLDIDRIKSNMKGLAPATISNTLELLRRLINFGEKKGLCSKSKFIIELPKKDNTVTEYLEPDEAKRFIQVLDGWKRQDVSRMLKLAMLTGMRRGEIFKLKINDLNFTQSLIRLESPKGKKTVSIPISKPVRTILEAQLKWTEKLYPESAFVFPGKKGAQRTDCSAAKRIKAKAQLPKKFRVFHGLRHHFAVMLANSGGFSLDMIGELLTHKSVEMTKRYGQFLPGTMKKASEKAAELIQNHMEHAENEKRKVHG